MSRWLVGGWNLRLWRRVKVAPGVSVNFSKSGPSLSLGPRGAKMTFSRRGRRETLGIPGTGIYATGMLTDHASASAARSDPALAGATPLNAIAVALVAIVAGLGYEALVHSHPTAVKVLVQLIVAVITFAVAVIGLIVAVVTVGGIAGALASGPRRRR